MTQQYGPQGGYHTPAYVPVPPQQPKRGKGKFVGIGCAGVVGLVVVIGVISAIASGTKDQTTVTQPAASAPAQGGSGTHHSKPKPAPKQESTLDAFKAYVNDNGTASDKKAIKHVTKVQGADEQNNILDTADIYTDYTGGIMGPGTGPAKLLASDFAEFQASRGHSSKNGLVTIYDANGEILSNGKF